ncbi:nucleotide exchange factor GrpE [Dactylosporangium roseum]|uniref:Nucleotide exchange factor GrpE n=1 Tax=Dactylosporangium roseum TaxID=47989 RepID=A0ABY5YVS4_9ACTN|nr:nucleotide exchange factor GrpE [Dactylosporangium roseum]UWZ33617.1 nucleotide exchange factor GrpE [Dactylosporangium roseum]
MSSNSSLRLIAVAVALIVAVLTGVATGLLSGAPDCPAAVSPAPVASTAPAQNSGSGVGIGDEVGTPNQPPEQKQTAPVVQGQQGQQGQAAPAAACTEQEAFGIQPALVAFVGALFVGAALMLLLLLSARRPAAPAATGGAGGTGGTGGAGRSSAADADRRALVQACIYVRDRVTSKALGDRLGTALQEAGVTTVEPVGARFDPAHHEAGGATPSSDPALIGSIAAVEVPGYVDRDGRVLRAPIVTVYQAARNAGGATGAHPTVAHHNGPAGTTAQQPRKGQQR